MSFDEPDSETVMSKPVAIFFAGILAVLVAVGLAVVFPVLDQTGITPIRHTVRVVDKFFVPEHTSAYMDREQRLLAPGPTRHNDAWFLIVDVSGNDAEKSTVEVLEREFEATEVGASIQVSSTFGRFSGKPKVLSLVSK